MGRSPGPSTFPWKTNVCLDSVSRGDLSACPAAERCVGVEGVGPSATSAEPGPPVEFCEASSATAPVEVPAALAETANRVADAIAKPAMNTNITLHAFLRLILVAVFL